MDVKGHFVILIPSSGFFCCKYLEKNPELQKDSKRMTLTCSGFHLGHSCYTDFFGELTRGHCFARLLCNSKGCFS